MTCTLKLNYKPILQHKFLLCYRNALLGKDTSILHTLGVVDFVDQLVNLYGVRSIPSIHIPFDSNISGWFTGQLMP